MIQARTTYDVSCDGPPPFEVFALCPAGEVLLDIDDTVAEPLEAGWTVGSWWGDEPDTGFQGAEFHVCPTCSTTTETGREPVKVGTTPTKGKPK